MNSYLLSKKTRNERFTEYARDEILNNFSVNVTVEAISVLYYFFIGV